MEQVVCFYFNIGVGLMAVNSAGVGFAAYGTYAVCTPVMAESGNSLVLLLAHLIVALFTVNCYILLALFGTGRSNCYVGNGFIFLMGFEVRCAAVFTNCSVAVCACLNIA